MITLSEAVIADFESHFKENERQDIRIYIAPAENTSRLELMLDNAQEEDMTYEVSGYRFCFHKDLMKKCGAVTIDLSDVGFVVEPSIPFVKRTLSCNSQCGSCSSSCKK